MSNYGEYLKERENVEIIEDEKGFVTFKIKDDECYIIDMYVKPQYRKGGVGVEYTNMVIKIAKEKGCNKIVESVNMEANNFLTSMKFVEKCGMKFDYKKIIEQEMLFYVKDI